MEFSLNWNTYSRLYPVEYNTEILLLVPAKASLLFLIVQHNPKIFKHFFYVGGHTSINILRKVQKILLYALKSKNTFQSFNMEVYEKIFFKLNFRFFKWPGKTINFTTYLVIHYYFSY